MSRKAVPQGGSLKKGGRKLMRIKHVGKGQYVCVVCGRFIRERKGEIAVVAEHLVWRDLKGNYHAYTTKRHEKCPQV